MKRFMVLAFSFFLLLNAQFSFGSEIQKFPLEVSGVDLVSGKLVSVPFSKMDKKGTVVVFLSMVCPCSIAHIPVLNGLHQEYKEKGFEFVGVHSNIDEEMELSKKFFQGLSTGLDQKPHVAVAFPVIQDQKSLLANAFKALKTPHAFIVGPDLKILYQGGVDDSRDPSRVRHHYLKDALASVSEKKEANPKEAMVLGCMIDYEHR